MAEKINQQKFLQQNRGDGVAKIQGILFDLDGTLLNTNELVVKSFQHTLKRELNLDVAEDRLYQYFGEPLRDTLGRFAADRVEELVQVYREFNIANHDRLVTPFPGVEETVKQLSAQGLKLAVVTSKIKKTAMMGLKLCGLEDYFQVVIALEDTEHHKPHPEPILKALEILELEKNQVIMVGDSTYDIRCAKNAGIRCAAVSWTTLPQQIIQQEGPDYLVKDMMELPTICLAG